MRKDLGQDTAEVAGVTTKIMGKGEKGSGTGSWRYPAVWPQPFVCWVQGWGWDYLGAYDSHRKALPILDQVGMLGTCQLNISPGKELPGTPRAEEEKGFLPQGQPRCLLTPKPQV